MSELTYYNKIIGELRTSVKEDCYAIARDMRTQDALEMWSAFRYSPIEATMDSFNKAFISMTAIHNGVPVCMFGTMPGNMTSAALWMLSTNGLRKVGIPFIRNCRRWLNSMLEIYPTLYGMVDLRNTASIRWIKFLGATWGEELIYGIDKMPFKTFYFKRS